MDKSICVVLLCDKAYFNKFINTCNQLVTTGNYHGNICLVIADDLVNDPCLDCATIRDNNVIVKHFPNIPFSPEFLEIQRTLKRDTHWFGKRIQYHKMHLFNTYFKQWNYIFYIDCGLTIFSDISPILEEASENTMVAHSDGYPTYKWKLDCQFNRGLPEYYERLRTTFNLEIDYFQTTIMLYDTNIIAEDTYDNILHLLLEYPICNTNDQGIIALYFTNIKPLFKQLKLHNDNVWFYDYSSRNPVNKYIILKSV